MTDQLPLFAGRKRAPGPLERSLAEALRAWAKLDHLTGAENASRRAVLRQLARAADEADKRMRLEDASPWTAASCHREYRAALDTYAPATRPTIDPHGAALEAEALAILESLDP